MSVEREKVVQVVMDNAASNISAGKALEKKFPHIFFNNFAARYIDMMIEE